MDIEELTSLAETTTDVDEQERLAQCESTGVRATLAGNENLASHVQVTLAADRSDGVLGALAFNTAATPEVQALLAGLDDGKFLSALAQNPNVTYVVQQQIATSHAASQLARSGAVDPRILRVMWNDYKDKMQPGGVFHALLSNSSLPADLRAEAVRSSSGWVKANVALDTSVAHEECWTLAKDPDPKVRYNLASVTTCPTEVLEFLSDDEFDPVRRVVALREGLPQSLYHKLSFDSDAQVILAVAANDTVNLTEDFRAIVVKWGNENLYEQAVKTGDPETAQALLADWPGSLKELVEASKLVNR